jgi:hypothetical protein
MPNSADYQIEIPPSFMALFTDPGRFKPNAAREYVIARYELCEDLSHMLTQTAQDMQFSLGIDESDVLHRCHLGLTGETSVVDVREAQWVVCRLAELLNWRLPAFAPTPLKTQG